MNEYIIECTSKTGEKKAVYISELPDRHGKNFEINDSDRYYGNVFYIPDDGGMKYYRAYFAPDDDNRKDSYKYEENVFYHSRVFCDTFLESLRDLLVEKFPNGLKNIGNPCEILASGISKEIKL